MNVTKTSNTNFNHSNGRPKNALVSNKPDTNKTAENTPKPRSNCRQLVPTQPTEYKGFSRNKPAVNSPFLAQYIHQVKSQKRRAFIGRKAPWQAKKSYQNSLDVIEATQIGYLDKSI